MTQIDDYVRRIRFWLPGPRGKVAAEDVRGTLDEILAARAETLGRSLTPQETAVELRAFGRPEIIASRYSPMRLLVSAGLMPAYVRGLGISTAAVIGVQIVLMVLAPEADVGRTLTRGRGPRSHRTALELRQHHPDLRGPHPVLHAGGRSL